MGTAMETEDIIMVAQVDAASPTENRTRLVSYAESQLSVILRRQALRPRLGGGSKAPPLARDNLRPWEFSGWGVTSYLDISPDDVNRAKEAIRKEEDARCLGPWTASAVASNAITGSIFYAFPPLTSAIGVYSPISLTIATLLLFLYRPLMAKLATAFPQAGSNYLYLLNTTAKSFAVLAAALTCLDYLCTALVTSSTAAVYIASSTTLPFPTFVLPVLTIIVFSLGALAGVRDGYRVSLLVAAIHAISVVALAVSGIVYWCKDGGEVLSANWNTREIRGTRAISRAIFDGICIGFLGLTGFECSPECLPSIKPSDFRRVLRSLHFPAMLFNGPVLLITYAVLPQADIIKSANILAAFGNRAGGRWLEIWIVVDAAIVLSFGVLTGILSTISLLHRMSNDRILPEIFIREAKWVKTPPGSVLAFVILAGGLYAATAADLGVLSQIFTVVWLSVMLLFPVSYIILKLNRPSLVPPGSRGMWLPLLTFSIVITVTINNLVLDIRILLYFAAYFVLIWAFFEISRQKILLLKVLHHTIVDAKWLSGSRQKWSSRIASAVISQRKQPVCLFVKSDNIHKLLSSLLYVLNNEDTSCVYLIHCYQSIAHVPSELDPNHKILDEAFPSITIHLIFIQSPFTVEAIHAISTKLGVNIGNVFMNAYNQENRRVASFGGGRIIGA